MICDVQKCSVIYVSRTKSKKSAMMIILTGLPMKILMKTLSDCVTQNYFELCRNYYFLNLFLLFLNFKLNFSNFTTVAPLACSGVTESARFKHNESCQRRAFPENRLHWYSQVTITKLTTTKWKYSSNSRDTHCHTISSGSNTDKLLHSVVSPAMGHLGT